MLGDDDWQCDTVNLSRRTDFQILQRTGRVRKSVLCRYLQDNQRSQFARRRLTAIRQITCLVQSPAIACASSGVAAAKKLGLFERELAAVGRRDTAAGLAHDQHARRHVPDVRRIRPVKVKTSGRQVAEVQRRRAGAANRLGSAGAFPEIAASRARRAARWEEIPRRPTPRKAPKRRWRGSAARSARPRGLRWP